MPIKKKKKAVKVEKLKPITLTVRAKDRSDIDALNELLKLTGEKTYTGALMRASKEYRVNKDALLQRSNNIRELEKHNKQLIAWLASIVRSQKALEAFEVSPFMPELDNDSFEADDDFPADDDDFN